MAGAPVAFVPIHQENAQATIRNGRTSIAFGRLPSVSLRSPMSGTAGTSPKACPAKIDIAIASARVSFGTDPRSTAFSGESDVQIAICASVIVAKNRSGDGARTHTAQHGTARIADHAFTRIDARIGSASLIRSFRKPPRNVPTKPVTTTTAPK